MFPADLAAVVRDVWSALLFRRVLSVCPVRGYTAACSKRPVVDGGVAIPVIGLEGRKSYAPEEIQTIRLVFEMKGVETRQ